MFVSHLLPSTQNPRPPYMRGLKAVSSVRAMAAPRGLRQTLVSGNGRPSLLLSTLVLLLPCMSALTMECTAPRTRETIGQPQTRESQRRELLFLPSIRTRRRCCTLVPILVSSARSTAAPHGLQ